MPELIKTDDGSLSCLDIETSELYHNQAGAYTESLQNYIEPSDALESIKKNGSLYIIDACFGLGYNTFVLLEFLLEHLDINASINILAIDKDPNILKHIPNILLDQRLSKVKNIINDKLLFGINQYQTQLIKTTIDLRCSDLPIELGKLSGNFDLVFHDPFSPKKMPELWTVDIFRKYYQLLIERKGRLLTYSSATAVRGGLEEAGFKIWKTTAVGGKSGGTLATISSSCPNSQYIFDFTSEEKQKLSSSSAVSYKNPSFLDDRKTILKRRVSEQQCKK